LAELSQIFGKMDNHVPPPGRDLIRKTLTDAGVVYSFYEVAWAQRKEPFIYQLKRDNVINHP